MIIDFHSHVLPGVDDGSRDYEMSQKMLTESSNQGISIQVATPHFYAHRMKPEAFFNKRQRAYDEIKGTAEKLGIDLRLGAEVAFFRGMHEWDSLEKYCIDGTNLLLVEMPFDQWSPKDLDTIEGLMYSGVRPIIAHLERFFEYQKNKDILYDLLDIEPIIQFNCEDLLKVFKKGKILKYIKECNNVILGSDCHNMDKRRQNLLDGRKVIEKKLGIEILNQIDDFGAGLLVK